MRVGMHGTVAVSALDHHERIATLELIRLRASQFAGKDDRTIDEWGWLRGAA